MHSSLSHSWMIIQIQQCELSLSGCTVIIFLALQIAQKCLLNNKCTKRTVYDLGAHAGSQISDSCHKKRRQHNEMYESHLASLRDPASTSSEMNAKSRCSSEDKLPIESDSTSLVNFICAFCQTWKISEVILHLHLFALCSFSS